MAYVPDNLALASNPVGGGAYPRVFTYYNSAADADATIVGASYFSDGASKGMRKGDLVDCVNVGTPLYKRYQVLSTSGAAATVQAPTAIT
ncbi:hypothetical protein IVB27_32435 [Bradyrhizobium sp. 197]|uniref:hypothetical protein n=1 Tax=Bradyrhizobium sp. 197 TaxID=2782663 RepID=UPI001FF9F412|nr:hypothetical protein [Bradyrhizobium sp. 197]MCK1479323.1 hypothetical protein [Bradyrhizobium sp. 197]